MVIVPRFLDVISRLSVHENIVFRRGKMGNCGCTVIECQMNCGRVKKIPV